MIFPKLASLQADNANAMDGWMHCIVDGLGKKDQLCRKCQGFKEIYIYIFKTILLNVVSVAAASHHCVWRRSRDVGKSWFAWISKKSQRG